MAQPTSNVEHSHVRFLQMRYDSQDSHNSALKLILTLMPQWASDDSCVEFVRFTDGITNTLLKAVNRRPGLSKQDVDREAILLRAYGHGTAVLIDREREAKNHELLMKHHLAPELLARFENGMLYRYISGSVAQHQDLSDPPILTAVARRLAQWHATVPCLPDQVQANGHQDHAHGLSPSLGDAPAEELIANAAPGKPVPNLWSTIQKWILALPTETEAQRGRQALLQRELLAHVRGLSERPGLGRDGLVFAHCDLLSANVIIHRKAEAAPTVSFIDYEYATPSPAAFDLANHFAEWAGYECDYSAVPTRSQRRAFIREYVRAFLKLSGQTADEDEQVRLLFDEVDVFRGIPGFYWGIWALIQSTISKIEFDYATYAESRLGEYWAYKAEVDGSRKAAGTAMPLRETTWGRE